MLTEQWQTKVKIKKMIINNIILGVIEKFNLTPDAKYFFIFVILSKIFLVLHKLI